MVRSSMAGNKFEKVETVDLTPKPGYLATPALNPKTGGKAAIQISLDKILRYQKTGPFHKFYEVMGPVRETLVDPEYVLGYNEDDWTGYCYAKRVAQMPNNRGDKHPTEPGFTFLVFVTSTLKAVEWGLEPCSRWETGMPMNLRGGKMGEVLWPKR